MSRVRACLAGVILVALGGCAHIAAPTESGRDVLHAAFDPAMSFAGDLRDGSSDELLLTVWASARDDYAPAYSLAIAYRCLPEEGAETWPCEFRARMLRTAPTISDGFETSLALFHHAREAASAEAMRAYLDEAGLDWLEADVSACPKGIFAMDSVRVADWNPDIHYTLQKLEDRALVLHPAEIRVAMRGTLARSTYQGWVLGNGVPAAVAKLVETLEPCWTPATSPPPWRREGALAEDR